MQIRYYFQGLLIGVRFNNTFDVHLHPEDGIKCRDDWTRAFLHAADIRECMRRVGNPDGHNLPIKNENGAAVTTQDMLNIMSTGELVPTLGWACSERFEPVFPDDGGGCSYCWIAEPDTFDSYKEYDPAEPDYNDDDDDW